MTMSEREYVKYMAKHAPLHAKFMADKAARQTAEREVEEKARARISLQLARDTEKKRTAMMSEKDYVKILDNVTPYDIRKNDSKREDRAIKAAKEVLKMSPQQIKNLLRMVMNGTGATTRSIARKNLRRILRAKQNGAAQR